MAPWFDDFFYILFQFRSVFSQVFQYPKDFSLEIRTEFVALENYLENIDFAFLYLGFPLSEVRYYTSQKNAVWVAAAVFGEKSCICSVGFYETILEFLGLVGMDHGQGFDSLEHFNLFDIR